jgi:protein-tyrosine phosphatase
MDADRIASKLYLGGRPRSCGPFDVVVLAAYEHQNIPLDCIVVRAPLDDAVPTQDEVKTALSAARKVQTFRRQGARVLVTCAQGINRSALVAALALMMEGRSAHQAIKLIRQNRKTHTRPLSNEAFVQVLRRYERARRHA